MILVVREFGTGNFVRLDADREPSPTIMADGIAGACRRGWQYWLEGEGSERLQMPPGVVPSDGSEVEVARIWVERSTGHAFPNDRSFLGFGHTFFTDEPMASIVAGRPVNAIIEHAASEVVPSQVNKPPYRVPSMAEIAAVPWNGRNALSTFSGCGGSSLGYKMAGFRVLWASEFVEAARDVYRLNHPDTILDGRDIREVKPQEILDALGMKIGQLDLLDGSPPCASFSTAGKRQRDWGKVKKYSDTEQRADDLFFEFARILDGLMPKVFVAENVSGLVKGTAKGYFLEILGRLKKTGYNVQAKLLDAQWLGVPQQRQRLIFIGVRRDLEVEPAFPKPLPYRYSVRDALPWITRAVHDTSGTFSTGEFTDKPCPAITVGGQQVNACHYKVEGQEQIVKVGANDGFGKETWQSPDLPAKTIGSSPQTRNGKVGAGDLLIQRGARVAHGDTVPENIGPSMEGYAVGEEWDRLRPGEQSDKFFSLVRADPNSPSPTITSGAGSGAPGSVATVSHPYERRKFSIAELKRLCAFPDDFVLTGTYGQQWERLGRAVPPIMMKAVAEVVRDQIFGKL